MPTPATRFSPHNHHPRAHSTNTSTTIQARAVHRSKQSLHIRHRTSQATRLTRKKVRSPTDMSSRDIVPYGNGRGSTRDLVPYGTGRESTQHGRHSTRDSRSHRTTPHGHTTNGDSLPYGSGRESTRHSERNSTRDSRSHLTTTRGSTSHRVYSPSPSTSGSDRYQSRSITQRGYSPSRNLARRDSRSNSNYAITQESHGRMSRHHNPVDESAFSDDDGDLPMRYHGRSCTCSRNRVPRMLEELGRLGALRPGDEFEMDYHDRGCTCSRNRGPRVVAEYVVREICPGDESDGYSSDEASRHRTTRRNSSTRFPITTGSSRQHTNTDSTRRGTMTSSRHIAHSTADGYRSTHGESSRHTRR